MKIKIIIWICLLVITAGSCIPSLFPLYTEKDLLTDERLLGSWEEYRNRDYTWTIDHPSPQKNKGFFNINNWSDYDSTATYRLKGSGNWNKLESTSALHLVKLGGEYYINLYPMDYTIDHEFLSWHLVEANICARVDFHEDTLLLSFFDSDFLEELIDNNRIKISHVRLDDRILLTASTQEIQKFILKYGHEPKAYMKADTLVRISD